MKPVITLLIILLAATPLASATCLDFEPACFATSGSMVIRPGVDSTSLTALCLICLDYSVGMVHSLLISVGTPTFEGSFPECRKIRTDH